jgi:4-diphosphocytidyl-2-C-methyl-D-erythritol kinase
MIGTDPVARRAAATAKINLALVVGPLRADRKHEVTTVLQRVALCDRLAIEPAGSLAVAGFADDTLVAAALRALADHVGVEPSWRVALRKRIPVAAGLGGGSSDAATALRLANGMLERPVADEELQALAAAIGADVPFFLRAGPQLGTGDGSVLEALDLPQDYWVLLLHPRGATKPSTAEIYRRFDERDGAAGFPERRAALLDAIDGVRRPRDLAALPPNDLASSPLAEELRSLGAFRADVSGAGPVVYSLFHDRSIADQASRRLQARGRTWIVAPAWYG